MDRNFLLAIVLSMSVLIGWDLLVAGPQREAALEARKAQSTDSPISGSLASGSVSPAIVAPQPEAISVEDAIARSPARVPIDTPSLSGSINLAGGRLDDLRLKNYRESVDSESPTIRLLKPAEVANGHYIQQGWIAAGSTDEAALWSVAEGARLTVETPVKLTRRAGDLVFEKTIAVDDRYMFTVTQVVRNVGETAQSITPYGLVIQRGVPADFQNFMILHEGPIAVIDDALYERKYGKAKTAVVESNGSEGWVGITNKYWLAAAIPPQGEAFTAALRNVGTPAEPIFQASYALAPRTVAPGETSTLVSHLFGGSKNVDTLQTYEAAPEKGGIGVKDFDKAVDWGNFFFLTRPIFYVMNFFGDLTGNFGVAILLLTLIIKALMFPLANKAYESMSKMKKLQPEVEKLRARFGEDKQKLQQEMMALYQKEKMNPLAGCLPILIQMPIFYALYKVLFVTIELRHEPFILWIKDLSAPDPTSIFNLFGLLPYDPMALPLIGAFLGVGVLPLLMGVSMWFQTKLNPPAADPMQQQIFAMLPIVFTFLFASFAAGLVLYWFWNTALSILQQWAIMKKNGVSIDWLERMPFLQGRKPAAEKK